MGSVILVLNTFKISIYGGDHARRHHHRRHLYRLSLDQRHSDRLGGPHAAQTRRHLPGGRLPRNAELAASVNHLLVWLYLINIGFVSLALKTSAVIATSRQAIEMLSDKLGSSS